MNTRQLRDLKVSALGLGCMGMSEFYGETDDNESVKTLTRALDLGITLFDTADMYGVGHNERLIGRFLKESGRRQEVVVATKFGIVRGQNGEFLPVDGRPEYVHRACDASLKRLGVDHIDLYYQHRVDEGVPIEETVGAMKELVEQGKVRYIGLSEASAETIRRADAVHPVTAVETEYNLWDRAPEENGIFAACEELGIGYVPYSPLGRGFITGQIQSIDDLEAQDVRRYLPRFQPENFGKNLELVRAIQDLAAQKGCTPPQLALAWVLAQRDYLVPIPGTRKIRNLKDNVGAAEITFTPVELKAIDDILPVGSAAGDRLADMSSVQH